MLTQPRALSPETEAFPTSLAQRGMWFLWRLAPVLPLKPPIR